MTKEKNEAKVDPFFNAMKNLMDATAKAMNNPQVIEGVKEVENTFKSSGIGLFDTFKVVESLIVNMDDILNKEFGTPSDSKSSDSKSDTAEPEVPLDTDNSVKQGDSEGISKTTVNTDFKNSVVEGFSKDLTSIHDTIIHKFHTMVSDGVINGYDAKLAADSLLSDIAVTFENDHLNLMNEKATFDIQGEGLKTETFSDYLHNDFLTVE